MSTEFDVLLGVDTLKRLRIGLTGVAHKYPPTSDESTNEKNEINEYTQFENINFDTKNLYNPELADYGSEEDQKQFMRTITEAMEEHKLIKAGAFCSLPESVVTIPVKPDVNYYTRQYPLPYHAIPDISKQLKEWLDAGIVKKRKASGRYNSPLLAISKKDDDGNPTQIRVCMDVRKINLHIPDNIDQFAVPNVQTILEKVAANGNVFSKLDLKSA
ncbi:hypothetical protein EDC96DRAFT_453952, partial [Choanephora cucurbitarum]